MKTYRRLICIFIIAAVQIAGQQGYSPTPEVYRALANISPDSLRGNLSFIASDLLEGRETPSRGLDLAAEYIAAQFRSAGLEGAGNDGYFQTARMLRISQASDGVEISIQGGSRALDGAAENGGLVSEHPLDLKQVPLYKVTAADQVQSAGVNGKAVLLGGSEKKTREIAKAVAALHPAIIVEIEAESGEQPVPRVIDPEEEHEAFGDIPRLVVRNEDAAEALTAANAGETPFTISVRLPESAAAPVKVRNVVGVLRGSDANLRKEYILITAHYDHLGLHGKGVFHGANDDGSGTVSVMEIGKALATLPSRPKRSIVFLTFFGEEEGSLGSRYYARHPVFPLSHTVANLNLEQVGRTDSNSGPEVGTASLTGYDYSTVGHTLHEAGTLTGVKVYENANGDEYFNRSDNETFAERGIPSHTVVVAYEYSDYHAMGDVWQKIDYDNMAKVDRMIALGAIMLAQSPQAPEWNRANPKTARFAAARRAGSKSPRN